MTATLEAPVLDPAKAQHLGMKIVHDYTSVMMGTLVVIGDRLGLYDVLDAFGPLPSDAFAARAGITGRYAKEWLSAMATYGYVSYDDGAKTFSLSPEQAFCLVNRDSPLYLLPMYGTSPDNW